VNVTRDSKQNREIVCRVKRTWRFSKRAVALAVARANNPLRNRGKRRHSTVYKPVPASDEKWRTDQRHINPLSQRQYSVFKYIYTRRATCLLPRRTYCRRT